jgi:hypothetical protein
MYIDRLALHLYFLGCGSCFREHYVQNKVDQNAKSPHHG